MALPTIPDVFRCTLNWQTTGGVTAHNVLHFYAPSKNEQDVADALQDNITSNMFNFIANGVELDSVDVIDLGSIASTLEHNFSPKIDGQGTGDLIPNNAAVLALRTDVRGPRGRGRIFIGPVCEGQLNDAFVDGTYKAALLTAWGVFKTAMQADGVDLHVASYVHEDSHVVTSFSMRDVAGTMRRRQNQLL